MTQHPQAQSEFASDMQLLAGVWALVCVAVLTTIVIV
jgi:hypothetical protein